jgi:hypothetical protein
MAAFFSASGAALSQQVANGKINVQSACALITWYVSYLDVVLYVTWDNIFQKFLHFPISPPG